MEIKKDLKKIALCIAALALASAMIGAVLGIFAYSQYYVPPVAPRWVSRVTRLLVDGNADVATVRCQGYTTQTAAILTVEQSDGTDVFTVDNSGNMVVSGTLQLGGYVSDEDSPVTFADNVLVDGAADVEQLVAQGYTTQTNFIFVVEQSDGTDVFNVDNDGDTVISGTLTISDAMTLADDITVTNIDVTGYVSIADALDVLGLSELDGGVTIDDTAFTVADITGNTVISGTLTVSDTLELVGAIISTSYVSIEDDSYFSGDLSDLAGDFTIADNLIVTGYVSIEDTLRVGGAVTLPYLTGAPANLVNGMIWMEADGLHIYYNGAEALVADGVP